MFVLQRQREAIDDRPKDFKKFGDAIVAFRFIDELKENIVDGTADKGS